MSTLRAARIAIIMAAYQGERFLEEQLRSLVAQTHDKWVLYVSDDGSTDGTRAIVQSFAAEQAPRQIVLTDGPGQGFSVNFLTALSNAPEADYYAFADQDDIWEADKLERALGVLSTIPADKPALYCARTRIVDESGHPTGFSPAFQKQPSFANALVQSLGGGNSMVMNAAACDLLREAGPDPDIVSHDWWAYQLISGAGGSVYYDPVPKVLYRQHGRNLVGMNSSLRDRLKRVKLLFAGRFSDWSERNIRALSRARHLLTPENQAMLDIFVQLRSQSLVKRLTLFRRSGVYRQTTLGNLGLTAAVIFNKL